MPKSSLLVSEYNVLWEALAQYEKYLENMSLSASDENEELKYDEKLQDLLNTRKTIQQKALNEYSLELK